MKRWLLLTSAAALTSGCGVFNKPPLPKMPAPENAGPPSAEAALTAKLRATDVIYFSLTKSRAGDEASAWQMVEQLQRGGHRVALGWAEIPAQQQPLLDQWQRQEISAAQLLEQLALPERAELMGAALRPDLAQVALGSGRELLAKIRAGETLSEDERGALPRGFRPRTEMFENFTDRLARVPRLRRENMKRLFLVHLVAEQTIAENIIRFVRETPNAKLLIFLPDDVMINPREIADFVTQKMPLRQMILDRTHRSPNEQRPLLAASG